MKYLFILMFIFGISINAQQVNKTDSNKISADTIKVDSGEQDSLEIYKPTINDYLVKTRFSQKKIYDTSFAIDRSYIVTQYNIISERSSPQMWVAVFRIWSIRKMRSRI